MYDIKSERVYIPADYYTYSRGTLLAHHPFDTHAFIVTWSQRVAIRDRAPEEHTHYNNRRVMCCYLIPRLSRDREKNGCSVARHACVVCVIGRGESGWKVGMGVSCVIFWALVRGKSQQQVVFWNLAV